MTYHILWKIKHVWNHQPGSIYVPVFYDKLYPLVISCIAIENGDLWLIYLFDSGFNIAMLVHLALLPL